MDTTEQQTDICPHCNRKIICVVVNFKSVDEPIMVVCTHCIGIVMLELTGARKLTEEILLLAASKEYRSTVKAIQDYVKIKKRQIAAMYN